MASSAFPTSAPRDALISIVTALWFPFAVLLLPVVGGAIGLTGEGGAMDVLRGAIVAVFYFAPFVVGVGLGTRAIRSGAGAAIVLAAWIGVVANLVILALSLMFLAGEFTNPH